MSQQERYQKETRPADTLALDFQPPECEEIMGCGFRHPVCSICGEGPGQLLHQGGSLHNPVHIRSGYRRKACHSASQGENKEVV